MEHNKIDTEWDPSVDYSMVCRHGNDRGGKLRLMAPVYTMGDPEETKKWSESWPPREFYNYQPDRCDGCKVLSSSDAYSAAVIAWEYPITKSENGSYNIFWFKEDILVILKDEYGNEVRERVLAQEQAWMMYKSLDKSLIRHRDPTDKI